MRKSVGSRGNRPKSSEPRGPIGTGYKGKASPYVRSVDWKIPAEERRPLVASVPIGLIDRLRRIAKKERRTFSDLVAEALLKYITGRLK